MSAIGYEVKTLENLIERKIINEYKKSNELVVTPVHAHILKYLIDNGVVYQRDLEKKFSFRRSTALGILKTMEKNDLIKRLNEENSRLKQIAITNKGIEKFDLINKKMKLFESVLVTGIEKNELNIFFKVMHKIKDNIKEEYND